MLFNLYYVSSCLTANRIVLHEQNPLDCIDDFCFLGLQTRLFGDKIGFKERAKQASNHASIRGAFYYDKEQIPCVLRQKQRIDTSRIAGFAFENAQSIKTKFA